MIECPWCGREGMAFGIDIYGLTEFGFSAKI